MSYPAGINLLKINKRRTKASCEICSKLTIKTPEQRQWRCSGVFIVNLEHTLQLALVFLLTPGYWANAKKWYLTSLLLVALIINQPDNGLLTEKT